MKVEIWSDVVCPWCYIGKRRFESALARFPHRDELEVVWRSFELNPDAPRQEPGDLADRLAAKYGATLEWARAAHSRVTDVAAGVGLDYRLDLAKPGNTFDAHRLLHLAREKGLQDSAYERFLAAYFSEGRPVGDRETLVQLTSEVGIDSGEARAALESDRYSDEVRADEREAARFGINGVPFFVMDRRYGVSGAQPPELILQALEQAWKDRHPISVLTPATAEAAACDETGCPI